MINYSQQIQQLSIISQQSEIKSVLNTNFGRTLEEFTLKNMQSIIKAFQNLQQEQEYQSSQINNLIQKFNSNKISQQTEICSIIKILQGSPISCPNQSIKLTNSNSTAILPPSKNSSEKKVANFKSISLYLDYKQNQYYQQLKQQTKQSEQNDTITLQKEAVNQLQTFINNDNSRNDEIVKILQHLEGQSKNIVNLVSQSCDEILDNYMKLSEVFQGMIKTCEYKIERLKQDIVLININIHKKSNDINQSQQEIENLETTESVNGNTVNEQFECNSNDSESDTEQFQMHQIYSINQLSNIEEVEAESNYSDKKISVCYEDDNLVGLNDRLDNLNKKIKELIFDINYPQRGRQSSTQTRPNQPKSQEKKRQNSLELKRLQSNIYNFEDQMILDDINLENFF